jgi:dTMP kinase
LRHAREHLERVIRPALRRGDWVICDRFTDATFAYQGGGYGVPEEFIGTLEQWVHGDCQPDLTFLFDVPTDVSRSRLEKANRKGRALDKFEREATEFFRTGAQCLPAARASGSRSFPRDRQHTPAGRRCGCCWRAIWMRSSMRSDDG